MIFIFIIVLIFSAIISILGFEIGVKSAELRISDERKKTHMQAGEASVTLEPHLSLRQFAFLSWHLLRIIASGIPFAEPINASEIRRLSGLLSRHLLRLLGNFLLPRNKELTKFRKSCACAWHNDLLENDTAHTRREPLINTTMPNDKQTTSGSPSCGAACSLPSNFALFLLEYVTLCKKHQCQIAVDGESIQVWPIDAADEETLSGSIEILNGYWKHYGVHPAIEVDWMKFYSANDKTLPTEGAAKDS